VTAVEIPVEQETSAGLPGFAQRLLRRGLAVACLAYLVVLIGVAIIAPFALPGVSDQRAGDLLAARQGPSREHVLGTDTLGRDVFDRLLVGTRVTLVGVAEALLVVLAVGVPLGLAAGYLRGWVDRAVSWLADLTFSMPAIIIVLVVLSVFPQSMSAAMVTFGLLAAPSLMRVVRSAVLPVREELYIAAARVSGLSQPYIVTRHVLPRIAGPVIVQASLLGAAALIVQTGLAFLGLVVAAPSPSWGGMVADGIQAIDLQAWLIWPPGIAIALTALALGLLGDAVRDATTESWAPPTRRMRQRPARGGVESTAPSVSLLAIEGLSVAFPTSERPTRVVDEVTFDIRAGETVGLVGESGCGKTITAMAILGLLPNNGQVESGRIMFDGHDLAALSERQLSRFRGRLMGFISQEPIASLNPVFTVGWQIDEAVRRHHDCSRRSARGRTLELLRRVQLEDPDGTTRRYPHELSGGMAQRVAIARALAGEPKLLIADEPTTALDVTVQAEILELLRELRHERELAVLLITHDWGVVADSCDRAVIMYAGQVVERAELVSLFRKPLHPYTAALLRANPHNLPVAHDLPTIPGSVPRPGAWPTGCRFHPRCRYATESCRKGSIPLERPASGRETRCIHHDALLAR
jgi:peptide/nickel transport system permease protein